jgi:nucleoside-diphosphate-sugar epimerase
MNKSILVIGGAGFLGKHILVSLLNQGFKNLCCGDLKKPDVEKVKFSYMNVLDLNSLGDISKYDIVLNCTGQITNPIEGCILQNSVGILNILHELSEKNHFIQVSTVNVYGTAEYADEGFPLKPETPYSAAKATADVLIGHLVRINYTILRISNLYGPGQNKGIMAYIPRSYRNDRKLEFNHNNMMYRTFLHVNDCVKVISQLIRLSEIPCGVFNLSGTDSYKIEDIIKIFERAMKVRFDIHWTDSSPYENIKFISDEKLKHIIPIEHKESLEDYISSSIY